jgi:pyruvate/2-oxoglutarate/acetoin dehydrogenase E1 component
VKNSGRVIIAEEAQRTSGWGAEVAAQISEAAFAYLKCPVTRIGAAEVPIPSSGIMEKEALPSTEMIERAIYTIC